MKRKVCVVIAVLVLALSLIGCSSSSSTTGTTTSNSTSKELMKNDKISLLMGDPDKYKGYPVELIGQVFGGTETKDGVSAFQMWTVPKGDKSNIIVYIKGSSGPKEDEYVKVKGTVTGKLDGKNGFGASITALTVAADSVEKMNPADVVAPAVQTVDVNKNVNQKGYSITLQKIEFAETETRVYLQVKNDTKGKINFWEHEAKATQNGKQFETTYNAADYPEISSDILPGVTSEGIIVFKPLDRNAKAAQFYFDGSFDDYSLHFEPAKFDVTW